MIEGRVAQILNDHELIINRGRKDGVARHMLFSVLAGEPLKVLDPETGESLGSLERSKATIVAREVHERFALCSLIARSERSRASEFFSPRRRSTVPASDQNQAISEETEVRDIVVGDRVKQSSTVSTAQPGSLRN